MVRVAWVLAILAVVGAFIFGQLANDRIADERAEGERRLQVQRGNLQQSVSQAKDALDEMKNRYDDFKRGTGEVERLHEEITSSWENLAESVGQSEQAIERLAAERGLAKTDTERNLAEIRELTEQIELLEKQIVALQDLMVLVKD